MKRLTSDEGFDVVFAPIGGQHLTESFQPARDGGQVITTTAPTQIDRRPMQLQGPSLFVIFMLPPLLTGTGRERRGAILPAVATLADAGRLQKLVDEMRFSLATAADACRRLESGNATGKVVIDITDNWK